jgi:hypothetical protein
MSTEKLPVSRVLEELVTSHTEENIRFRTIRDSLDGQGFCLLMIILAFPAALPLPYPPGFTTILGVPLALLSIQMLFGLPVPWLPKWLENRMVPRSLLVSVVEKAMPILLKLEHFVRPRMAFASMPFGEKLVGLASLLGAILISIPIPFGHMLPGFAVLLMSLGFLDRDGVTIIGGIILVLLGVCLDVGIVFAGTEAIYSLFSFVEQHYHHSHSVL